VTIHVAGIDPGYASGGYCVWEVGAPVGMPLSMPATTGATIPDRVDQAAAWFAEMIHAAKPSVVALEDQHGVGVGKAQGGNSGANTAWVREVVGGIRCECFLLQIPIQLISPTSWRARIGVPRNATKKQAWKRLCELRPAMAKMRTNEHSRDAAVIAFAGSIAVHLWLYEWKAKHP